MPRFLSLLLFLALAVAPFAGEDETESRNQIYEQIKGLNNPFLLRQKFVNELTRRAEGKERNVVLSQLLFGLSLENLQITEGIVETYSRLNDPSAIPLLHQIALYNPNLDARAGVITHLPPFYVRDRQARLEIIEFYEAGEEFLPDRLLTYLREPPLDNGRFNHVRDKLRQDIEMILTQQLEPVEAVMQYLETSHQNDARAQLKRFLGVDLGTNKGKWMEFWRGRGATFVSPAQAEIFDTQTTAAQMLALLGAEGTPAICDKIRWICATPFAIIRAAAVKMLEEMLIVADREAFAHRAALARGGADQPEEIWRERRLDAAARLRELTFELAGKYLVADGSLFGCLLIDCLGETRETAAMKFLREVLRSGRISFETTLHLAAAFGKIGDDDAVKLLTLMAEYQGIAAQRDEQVREYLRVRAAIKALTGATGEFIGDRWVVRHPEAATAATEFLFELLADGRGIVGAPDYGQKQTVRAVTRSLLGEAWRTDERDYRPEKWREIYERLSDGEIKN
ncbi:hypothetical protein FACS1894139_12510 [Planctomycetales bacterium]|nr:hypothetical protein FACS1894108_01930 [Planctomycetales bacterium]GHT06505.1 hypothetical protein FACS1894139_12510 [Planctomycetales bacterium]